ncbi:hypothetical protein EYR38_000955 [Pleurotus pulmonarius]|nr:hypothetical protein EYR38_000955 [Pleurotus pulmonarius]
MLHPHFLLWIVLVLVTFLTPSSATQTTFKAGDAGLQFSAGWANRTLNDIPFLFLAGEGDVSARLLGMTVITCRPIPILMFAFLDGLVGVTQIQYTGFKLPVLSLYRVCLDGTCSTVNATDSTAVSPPPSVLFTLPVDPTSPHTLLIANAVSTSILTFISLGVTTADSNVSSTSSSTSSSASSATTAIATATAAGPTSTNGNQQGNSGAGPGSHALSTTIILLVILGSISILVGLVVFLQRVRQRRLEFIRNGGDDGTFGTQKAVPPNPSPAPQKYPSHLSIVSAPSSLQIHHNHD